MSGTDVAMRQARLRPASPGLGEVISVWAAYTAIAVAISLTERRRQAINGPWEAAGSPVLAFTAHPWSLAAVPQATIAWARLPVEMRAAASTRAAIAGIVGGSLVASRRPPGRPRLAVESGGVAIVVAAATMTGEAIWQAGCRSAAAPAPGDRLRLGLAQTLVLSSVPWILADLGLYSGDFPGLRRLFLSRETPISPGEVAVHLGHHHGMDGTLLALTALALSRPLHSMRHDRVRAGLSLSLSMLLVYGLSRTVEDFWNEQVVKRGRAHRKPPIIVRQGRPEGRWAWVALGAGAVAVDRSWFRRGATRQWWWARTRPTFVSARHRSYAE